MGRGGASPVRPYLLMPLHVRLRLAADVGSVLQLVAELLELTEIRAPLF